MDAIMAELLAGASAVGAWLIGPKGDVIAGAGTTFIDLRDHQHHRRLD